MSRTQGSLIRKAVFASLAALCASPAVMAQTGVPATGLGQAWPNAADVSANPNWHVYVFVLNGIKYVQVNDLNGIVHAAIATANGTSIVLPVGVDAQNVGTSTSSSNAAQTVYSDGATTLIASPQNNGTTKFTVLDVTTCPSGCSGGGGS